MAPLLAINILLAWSFWFPVAAGSFSMATPAFAAIGGYSAAKLAESGSGNLALQLILAAVLGLLASIVLALISMRIKGFSFAIVTLGISEGVRIGISNIDALGGPSGIPGILPSDSITTVGLGICVGVAIFSWIVYSSRLGRMIDALGFDEPRAEAIGVPATRVRLFVFMSSGVVGALAGACMVRYSGFIQPDDFGLPLLIQALAYVVLGGLGSFYGPFLGAALLTAVTQMLTTAGHFGPFVFAAVLIIVILVRRDGLLERSRWLQRRRVGRLLPAAVTRSAQGRVIQPDFPPNSDVPQGGK